MIKFLKLIELPHVFTYKWKWMRRVMIIITFPQEIVRAIYQTYCNARPWWNWDGTVDPNGVPVMPQ
jgi:hypothetical protein